MTVELTSPVLGQAVGSTYTGDLEAWLLSQGYAKQAAYTGPGVANTGATDVDPGDDPRLAENREDPYFPTSEDRHTTIANDADNLTKVKFPAPSYDFDADASQATAEAPSVDSITPNEGDAAGGTEVTIVGSNLSAVTGVTFDAVAGTSLTLVDEYTLTVVTPAGAAGAVDVVVTNPTGSDTVVDGFTYEA